MAESPTPTPPPNPRCAAILLAAGKGTRMHSSLHKVLHAVGGRPMLLHLLDSLAPLAPWRTFIVVGDRAEQVARALGERDAELVIQNPQRGTGHAVLQAAEHLPDFDGPVLILFGDVPLVETATMRRLLAALDHAAIAVLGFRPEVPGAYGRILADSDGRIEKMVEAKDASARELAVPLCNSGLMAVRGPLLRPLLKRIGNDNAAGEYYLPDIVMLAIADGHGALVLETSADEVAGVNSRAELADAEARFQRHMRQKMQDAGVTLVAPETVFFASDTRIGADTVVEPYVLFGPGVDIEGGCTIRAFSHLEGARIEGGCEVGPYARLRPGTLLRTGAKIGNFVETKKAVLGPGAKANHLSYLGDAEIGARVNIGAGTITCNYDGFGKYRTLIGDGAFIGSNSSLVAPVSIGARAIVGAGSTVSGSIEPDALALTRAKAEVKPGWAARFRAKMQNMKGKR